MVGLGSNFAIMMTGLSTVLLVMVGALLIADGKLRWAS